MARLTRPIWLLLALLVTSPAGLAQELTCDDIEFDSSATDAFPSVAQSCHSIVERDGKLYVRLVADVVQIRADGSLVLELKGRDGSRIRQDFSPPRGFRAMIDGKPKPTRDLVRGQEIRLYLPSDRWQVIQAARGTRDAPASGPAAGSEPEARLE